MGMTNLLETFKFITCTFTPRNLFDSPLTQNAATRPNEIETKTTIHFMSGDGADPFGFLIINVHIPLFRGPFLIP